MKMHSKPVFSLLAVFTIAMTLGISNAFAEVATVSTPQGTSVPGCEATNECYIPYEITINVGEEITWSNDDSAAHTVTAGSASDGPSGVFDSSLFMAGTTFS
ncbi:MAG: PEFG-CTERM domain-containing protein, partial [Candidatus Nitrosomaritimum aestuariumsis]